MEAFEFEVSRAEFLRAMEAANHVAAMVCVEIRDREWIQVEAFKDGIAVATKTAAALGVRGKIGARVALYSTDVVALLKAMESQTVEVRHERDGWVEVRGDPGSVFNLVTGNTGKVSGFHWEQHSVDFQEIDAGLILAMIEQTLFSVSKDESRRSINGVLFESCGDVARMVATDAHRLARVERRIHAMQLVAGVIPREGILKVKRLLEEHGGGLAGLAFRAPYMFVAAGKSVLAVKLAKEPFPPYEQVLPKYDDALKIDVDRRQLSAALDRCQVLANLRAGAWLGIRISVKNGHLTMESRHPDRGCSVCVIPCAGAREVPVRCINPDYLQEHVSSMSGVRVEMMFDPHPLTPISVQDPEDGTLGVIMPMRPWEEEER